MSIVYGCKSFISSLVAIGLLAPVAVFAQQPPNIPSTVQPGSVERQINKPREPVPADQQQPVPVQLDTQSPPANAASLSFPLVSLEVGNSRAIPSSALTAPYASLLGQTITVARVYQIAAEMTARYRSAGYILSSVVVPQQTIKDGHVTLQAVEGYVSAVTIEGDVGHRDGLFDKMRRRVLADRPLRNSTLERFLLLLNDLPGMTAQGVLQPAKDTSGASELIVRLHKSVVNISASGSNRGSRLQGPVQLQGTAALNSIFGTLDQTSLQYLQASDSDKLRFYSLTHRERITASGLDLTLSANRSKSNTELGKEFLLSNLQTDSKQARIDLAYPIIRLRALNVALRGAFTYSDGRTDAISEPFNHDVIAAVRTGINMDVTDAAGGVNLFDVEYSHGLNAAGASRYGDPLASRPGGRPDFSKITTNLARLQSLGGPFSLLLALNGQFAFNKTLIAEEFAYGGEYFGRAYDVSELVGDSGVAAKLELRYTLDTPVGIGATFYGFAEDGKVWRRITTDVNTPKADSAVSVGGGLRFTLTRWCSGYVEVAKPTNHIVAAEGNESTRVFGGLQFSFAL
jgi:hemolysin activation/secretion protein